jgi:hypothetical protein
MVDVMGCCFESHDVVTFLLVPPAFVYWIQDYKTISWFGGNWNWAIAILENHLQSMESNTV